MTSQILYNQDDLQDTIYILRFINDFTKKLGVHEVELDTGIIQSVVTGCKYDFPHKEGLEKASAFKQVANFVCHFVAERPIFTPFNTYEQIAKIENHQNAVVAFHLAVEALYGSTIEKQDGEIKVLNKINYSLHSYVDIIEALSNVTPMNSFNLVSVLFEQMCYKSNPECQYSVCKTS